MALQGLISKMGEIAAPVIEAYHDDLNVHDARIIEDAKLGDVFLWAPVRNGTHLVVLARGLKPNTRGAEHYKAVQGVFDPAVWYLIGIDSTDWSIGPCKDHAEIVQRWGTRARTGETVSEVHL
jgi:hypothetical protein